MRTSASLVVVGLLSSLYVGRSFACPDPPCGPPPAPERFESSKDPMQQSVGKQDTTVSGYVPI